MGWPNNGQWDRAVYGASASSFNDLAEISEALALAYNERMDILGLPLFGWNYDEDNTHVASYPAAADFTTNGFQDFSLSGLTAITYNAQRMSAFVASGTGIQGKATWYKEAACVNSYTVAEINALTGTTLGISFTGGYLGKYGDGVIKIDDAMVYLIAKTVFDICVFAKISGTPTDLRPLLTDQS